VRPRALGTAVVAAVALAFLSGCSAVQQTPSGGNPCGHTDCGLSARPTPTPAPTPFDTGNPTANDTSLAATLSAACPYYGSVGSVGCENASISAVNSARAGEGLGPLELPTDFWAVPYDQQSFIVSNEERVSRNLPPFVGINSVDDADALQGAQTESDPHDGGNWADGPNTVYNDFLEMYDDGYSANTVNVDCGPTNMTGCWGHRHTILENFGNIGPGGGYNPAQTLQFGAACVPYVVDGSPTLSCDLEGGPSPKGPYSYTWADALAAGA
jgi:hypothetical protein